MKYGYELENLLETYGLDQFYESLKLFGYHSCFNLLIEENIYETAVHVQLSKNMYVSDTSKVFFSIKGGAIRYTLCKQDIDQLTVNFKRFLSLKAFL